MRQKQPPGPGTSLQAKEMVSEGVHKKKKKDENQRGVDVSNRSRQSEEAEKISTSQTGPREPV